MLEPKLDRGQLEGLAVRARGLVEGLYVGEHGSIRRGQGADFFDYRPYCAGDDVGRVDWKLFGRTDRHYVRRSEQLGTLNVYVMVDRTASMGFSGVRGASGGHGGGEGATKFGCASVLAGAVALLAVRQGDRVGLGLYTDRVTQHVAGAGGWGQFQRVCLALEEVELEEGPGEVRASLRDARGLMRGRGLAVLMGDFLEPAGGLLEGLEMLRQSRVEVVVFQILTRDELELDLGVAGRARFVDPETSAGVVADPQVAGRRYREVLGSHLEQIRRGCAALGVDYALVRTDEPLVGVLRRQFGPRKPGSPRKERFGSAELRASKNTIVG